METMTKMHPFLTTHFNSIFKHEKTVQAITDSLHTVLHPFIGYNFRIRIAQYRGEDPTVLRPQRG